MKLKHAETWINLTTIVLNERGQTEKYVLYGHIHTRSRTGKTNL